MDYDTYQQKWDEREREIVFTLQIENDKLIRRIEKLESEEKIDELQTKNDNLERRIEKLESKVQWLIDNMPL
jgi:BMFP domain-containing protein YqiC